MLTLGQYRPLNEPVEHEEFASGREQLPAACLGCAIKSVEGLAEILVVGAHLAEVLRRSRIADPR